MIQSHILNFNTATAQGYRWCSSIWDWLNNSLSSWNGEGSKCNLHSVGISIQVPPKIIMVIIINHVLINSQRDFGTKKLEDLKYRAFWYLEFLKVGRNVSYSNILELEDDLLSEIEYPRILSV